jgi:hypothetical protein
MKKLIPILLVAACEVPAGPDPVSRFSCELDRAAVRCVGSVSGSASAAVGVSGTAVGMCGTNAGYDVTLATRRGRESRAWTVHEAGRCVDGPFVLNE